MTTKLRFDFWLLLPVTVLTIISLTTLLSLNGSYFKSQLFSLAVAFLAFLFFSQLNIELFKKLALPLYILSLVLLSIVLLIGIESRGAIRWIDIFGVSIQFSELLKPLLALSFASFVAQHEYPTIKSFFAALLFVLPIVVIIALQPDLGTGLLYLSVVVFTLIVVGVPLRWFALSAVPFLLVSPLIWTMLHDYQRQRVLAFLHPASDPLGTSYNSIQAIIAVGSGSFGGKGLSQGTQSILRFLPERHTDFIFATIAEGLGFVGATIVVVILLLLCYRIYVIFKDTNDLFSRIFVLCAFGFILFQGLVNIGMNIGVVPIIGITLPFVSFGGNSLISNFIFLGILSSLSLSQRNRDVLQIR